MYFDQLEVFSNHEVRRMTLQDRESKGDKLDVITCTLEDRIKARNFAFGRNFGRTQTSYGWTKAWSSISKSFGQGYLPRSPSRAVEDTTGPWRLALAWKVDHPARVHTTSHFTGRGAHHITWRASVVSPLPWTSAPLHSMYGTTSHGALHGSWSVSWWCLW